MTHMKIEPSPSERSALSRQILTFIAIVLAFSSVPYTLIIHTGHLATGNGMLVAVLMWCPALAAFSSCGIFRIDIASLGWNWRPVRYEVWAYLLPIFYSFPVYVAAWLSINGSFAFAVFAAQSSAAFGFPHWPHTATWLLTIPAYASFGVVGSMARALGEEIGWRGFLLPRLVRRLGFTGGCLLSGCIWAVWHYPLLLFADYNSGTPRLYALSCFTLMVIGAAFIFGWFRLKSGSLWPAAMLHASHNLFIQAIFDRMTNPVGKSLYVTTEFGFGLVLTIGACAFYLWTRRGEVEDFKLQTDAGLTREQRFDPPPVSPSS
jgi:membrane protease YdiL (CAAX protease family)